MCDAALVNMRGRGEHKTNPAPLVIAFHMDTVCCGVVFGCVAEPQVSVAKQREPHFASVSVQSIDVASAACVADALSAVMEIILD